MAPLRVALLHPDLGIGGAERLCVDVALSLQERGHTVHVFTAHHDHSHCFPETTDGTLKVTVAGDWLPHSVCGWGRALCAWLRMFYLAFCVVYFSGDPGGPFHVAICDQVPAAVPLFRLCTTMRVVFYCHYPDLLLSPRSAPFSLRRFYRLPLDHAEEWATGLAHRLCVNSRFTASVFRETFPSLSHRPLRVIYPSVRLSPLLDRGDGGGGGGGGGGDGGGDGGGGGGGGDGGGDGGGGGGGPQADDLASLGLPPGVFTSRRTILFLSINRYEHKKGLELALHAMAHLRPLLSPRVWPSCHLVVAGGFDPQSPENAAVLEGLRAMALALGLRRHGDSNHGDHNHGDHGDHGDSNHGDGNHGDNHVTFLKSPCEALKLSLLACCRAVLYTPPREHFGIVPLEAMAAARPVIAVDSGGPLETVA
uniref:Alpha-1,3/1,6-mannosyltransferase ALG2 n=1 Tax=Petromyzon marinus TaxID=7757 RepID=A0AAJ7SIP7_PETMA